MSLLLENLRHHRRLHLAVALGVAAATAVLTGAILVGDSMQGSLRHLTLDRLGQVDEILIAPRFFRSDLAGELAATPEFKQYYSAAVPAIVMPGTLENPDRQHPARAGNINIFAAGSDFWPLWDRPAAKPAAQTRLPSGLPASGEIVLNEPAAEALHLTVDQIRTAVRAHQPIEIILRIGQASQIPADSPLGRKTETVRSRRLAVVDVIPATGVGRFGLRPTQQLPANAYMTLEPLQAMLDQPHKVNAILVAGSSADAASTEQAHAALVAALHPKLEDYGIQIRETKHGYFNVTIDRMVIEPVLAAAAEKAFAADRAEPAFVYLANYILAGSDSQGKIPYSTIAAYDFDPQSQLGPFRTPDGAAIGPLADDEIVLNSWTFDDLKAQGVDLQPGDPVKLVYFEPESTHGKITERTTTFKLKAVVDLAGPAADSDFTPELKGVTDEDSIANWNPPFPYDAPRVRSTPPKDQDDKYWKKYKATPKGFIALKKGRELWGSRFGDTTSLRIPARAGLTVETLIPKLKLDPTKLSFEFMPVKRYGLMAASGTTPFGMLFFGFSFFIMAAAVMLIVLLFRLGIEQRAKEIGLLAAVGWSARRIRGVLLKEGLLVAAVGAAAGVAGGVGYAWLMLAGLRTWWLGAVSTPFLQLYVPPLSLAFGYASGVLIAGVTIWWALRRIRQASVRSLLGGQVAGEPAIVAGRSQRPRWIAAGLLLAGAALGAVGSRLGGEAQAGAFFGAGSLVLTAALTWIAARLRGESGSWITAGGAPLARLAFRNGGRHPGRSTLTIGLVAAASFLIISISAFRLDPPSDGPRKESGNGGFALLAQSDQPLYHNLDLPEGRDKLSFDEEQERLMAKQNVFALRVQSGDDASCLNLYQPRQPRWVGVPQNFIERGGFAFSGSAATTSEGRDNPWLLLNEPLPPVAGQAVVPVIIDENTALYSLHLGSFVASPIGKQFTVDDGRGGTIPLQVVGLLKNSIFQGDLIVSEDQLVKHYPAVSGYRMFLVEVHGPTHETTNVETTLEAALGDYGFDAEPTEQRLADLMVVQNTYLSTFQSLGGLGLLLGTFGLATVQLRNVFERRGELALLRAVGFRRAKLAWLVMLENASLLLAGLLAGTLAALVAVAPHLARGGAGLPWLPLLITLALVLIVGLLAGLAAVRATLAAPLLPALREE